jgi:YidC/Oxa1 family membrane protein insertase
MILGSLLGQIFSPIFHAMSFLLAFYYGLINNYVVAITLLTFTVMIVSFPLNRASTRSMFKMQLLAPEMQKIRNKYKVTRDTPALERQELRQKMNEETMALYRENNVSMLGGCLPNLAVFPIFIVLYDVIRGLTNTCKALTSAPDVCATSAQLAGKPPQDIVTHWAPRYAFYPNTDLYRNLEAANGQMKAFGINLANTVRTPQAHWYLVLPFVLIVLVAVALQYLQLRQMTNRNKSTAAGNAPVAQQMQTMQRIMPVVMAVIYISIPAAVVIYFIASSLFRIGQQEWMFRRDPQITAAVRELKNRKAGAPATKAGGAQKGAPEVTGQRPRTFRERLALAIAPPDDTRAPEAATSAADANGRSTGGKGATRSPQSSQRSGGGQKSPAKQQGNRPQGKSPQNRTGSGSGAQAQGGAKSQQKGQPPAGGKRPATSGQGGDKQSSNGSDSSDDTGKSGSTSSNAAPPSAAQRRRQRRSG